MDEKPQLNLRSSINYIIVLMVISLVLLSIETIPFFVFFEKKLSFHQPISQIMGYTLFGMISFIAVLSSFVVCHCLFKPFSKEYELKGIVILITFILSSLTIACISYLNVIILIPSYKEVIFKHAIHRGALIGFVSALYTYFIRVYYQKQLFELEIEILKKENLKNQFEALKNEISPHFLFNSLNALQAIIAENQSVAREFVYHLSSVLRYTLQSSNNVYVSLKEELQLADSYIYLLEMRYGHNLTMETTVSKEYGNKKILPLTIQLLIENAIKHNEISKKNPLWIKIYVDKNDHLITVNNLQHKITREPSLGIGLSNLIKRYRQFSGKDILIVKSNDQFRVEVPLIT